MSGLEVFNTTGTVQVRNDERPFSLRRSGYLYDWDFTVGASNVPTPIFSCGVSVAGMNSPLVLFRAQGSNSRVTALQIRSDLVVFYKWWNLPITNPIEYFIFDDWAPPERASVGLQLYRETPPYDLVFDSSWYLMKIIESLPIPAMQPVITGGPDSMLVLATSQPAGSFCVGVTAPRIASRAAPGSGGEDGTVLAECLWCDGPNVGVSWVPIDGSQGLGGSVETGPINRGPNNLLIVDSTWLPIPYG